jgi:hypothetical protein
LAGHAVRNDGQQRASVSGLSAGISVPLDPSLGEGAVTG